MLNGKCHIHTVYSLSANSIRFFFSISPLMNQLALFTIIFDFDSIATHSNGRSAEKQRYKKRGRDRHWCVPMLLWLVHQSLQSFRYLKHVFSMNFVWLFNWVWNISKKTWNWIKLVFDFHVKESLSNSISISQSAPSLFIFHNTFFCTPKKNEGTNILVLV